MADVLCGPHRPSGGGVAGAHECVPRRGVRVKLERVAAKHPGESQAQRVPEPKQVLPLSVKYGHSTHAQDRGSLMTSRHREAPRAPFPHRMFPSNVAWLFL